MWLKFEEKILKIVRVMVRAVLEKRVSRKTHLKFWTGVFIAQVAVWETLDTPQEKREIKQKKKIFHVWNRLPYILEGSN